MGGKRDSLPMLGKHTQIAEDLNTPSFKVIAEYKRWPTKLAQHARASPAVQHSPGAHKQKTSNILYILSFHIPKMHLDGASLSATTANRMQGNCHQWDMVFAVQEYPVQQH